MIFDEDQGLSRPIGKKSYDKTFLQDEIVTVPPKIVVVNLPGLNILTTLSMISLYWWYGTLVSKLTYEKSGSGVI